MKVKGYLKVLSGQHCERIRACTEEKLGRTKSGTR